MGPCCIRAASPSKGWQKISKISTDAVVDRLQLLREAPEFVAMVNPEQSPIRTIFTGPETTSGRVLIGVHQSGALRLIGCPDQQSPDGMATVVGELLAVSGRLWNQQASVVCGVFEKEVGIPLVEAVRRRADAGWKPDKFMLGLALALKEGKFPVVMFVDRFDPVVGETMDYLLGLNVSVQLLGYVCFQDSGIQVIRPVLLGQKPGRGAGVGLVSATAERQGPAPAAAGVAPVAAAVAAPSYEPLPTAGTSPKQQEILKRLVQLEDLGLVRRGLEFFAPGVERRPAAEGTIVIATEKTRWPFVSEEEVIVVVRTSREHLAGFLGMKQQEVEDFLSSLPREQRKERKGAILLRASNPFEAGQLVNELKALKEVAAATSSKQ